LTELCYRWFCPENGKILDPFAGGSVRGVVAGVLGFDYTGIELREEQVSENIRQLDEIANKKIYKYRPRYLIGDSAKMELWLNPEDKFDFIFGCPPYYNLEVYSDLEGELSNIPTYDKFIEQYNHIITLAVERLKENRFACFVVTNIRDAKGFYYGFVEDTIKCFKQAGAEYYNEMVLLNAIGSLPVRVKRQFNSGRKIGRCHQNILVFFKGDPQKIKEIYGELDLKADDTDDEQNGGENNG
jgi:DNA modification methylase